MKNKLPVFEILCNKYTVRALWLYFHPFDHPFNEKKIIRWAQRISKIYPNLILTETFMEFCILIHFYMKFWSEFFNGFRTEKQCITCFNKYANTSQLLILFTLIYRTSYWSWNNCHSTKEFISLYKTKNIRFLWKMWL